MRYDPWTPGEKAAAVIVLSMLAAIVGVVIGVWLSYR